MRVFILSHAHPQSSVGGGENAAWNEFSELNQTPGCEALFVGVDSSQKLPLFPTLSPIDSSGKNWVISPAAFDAFYLSSNDPAWMWKQLLPLLKRFNPDVIHLHHYHRIGVEIIPFLKSAFPKVPIFLTLHEFLAICHNHGQMIKTDAPLSLCSRPSAAECSKCFFKTDPESFHLRKHWIFSHFKQIDGFISPSHFLIERYQQWGLEKNKLFLIENGQPQTTSAPDRIPSNQKRNSFGFFGKLSDLKGVLLLLEAIELLISNQFKDFEIHLFGAEIEGAPDSFRRLLLDLARRLPEIFKFHGRYQPSELPKLMALVDWVVVPSIWWENSPLVIQEALQHQRPVICSNIGGMAEKVRHLVDGLHFRARDKESLAHTLKWAATDSALWKKLKEQIKPPVTVQSSVASHLQLFKTFQTK